MHNQKCHCSTGHILYMSSFQSMVITSLSCTASEILTILTKYVTVRDLEKSFSLDNEGALCNSCGNILHLLCAIIPNKRKSERFQTAKVAFKVTQSLAQVPFDKPHMISY